MLCTARDSMQNSKSHCTAKQSWMIPQAAFNKQPLTQQALMARVAAVSCKDLLSCLQHSKWLVSGEPCLALQVDGANFNQHLHL